MSKALQNRINLGYVKPTKREYEWMKRHEGEWTVCTIHLGLYGEEVYGRRCKTFEEFRKAVRWTRSGWVIHYIADGESR